MNVNVMMQYVTYGLAMIGGLAFLVSIIVQVIKELPFLKKYQPAWLPWLLPWFFAL